MSVVQVLHGSAPVRRCVPGWPFEWVSGRGRYEGKTESLVLVHFAGVSMTRDGRRTLLLTAKDRRRRSWSTVLTFDDGPLLHEFERAVAGKLKAPLRELGDVTLGGGEEPRAPSACTPAAELNGRSGPAAGGPAAALAQKTS